MALSGTCLISVCREFPIILPRQLGKAAWLDSSLRQLPVKSSHSEGLCVYLAENRTTLSPFLPLLVDRRRGHWGESCRRKVVSASELHSRCLLKNRCQSKFRGLFHFSKVEMVYWRPTSWKQNGPSAFLQVPCKYLAKWYLNTRVQAYLTSIYSTV